MEVADQWRREWAGTAEYGKVVEGGVTRRVARAMEVLHASGPGAKMRVMRAAYHASAGPGLPASSYMVHASRRMRVIFAAYHASAGTCLPASSYMVHASRRVSRFRNMLNMRVMRAAYHASDDPGLPTSSYMVHASRRVFSSGFNFLEPPSLPTTPTRPLEISSTPLESSPESHTDTENYKVTEPDDFEISEPSKWRASTSGNIRMPSEESSSTDNASIIDLDHRNLLRKCSYDSGNSDITHSGRNSRVSPLLDAPVTLSTLKFKSLLNGSNEWNSRRKSYSFEDTSPLTETILHSNDTLAMESSTDSGICKSTELVDDHADDNTYLKYFDSKERDINKQDDSFQSWLSKNRQNNSFYKGPKFKSYREHEVVKEDPAENNITLQSTGKVSITLPIKVETENGYHYQKNYISEEGHRKVKKVEFCKTELHFAADTGKVNIIATDEKPPPTNDFRKRRSAFVPMHELTEQPITLFGEKVDDFSDKNNSTDSLKYVFSEFNECDENTAATKSILKNKIPKPKPYLLGENMVLGFEDGSRISEVTDALHVPTAVSLINSQIKSEKHCDNEIAASFLRHDKFSTKNNAIRAMNEGPSNITSTTEETHGFRNLKTQKVVKIHEEANAVTSAKNLRSIKRSPTPARLKTRELRDSDFTYFGIEELDKRVNDKQVSNRIAHEGLNAQDIFQSVKLIQQVSNSVCNSETEDAPEYINIPLNINYAPIPTPRIRTKYDDKPNQIEEIKVFKPIIEQDIKTNDVVTTRRSKVRRHEEHISVSNRSVSEPRKSYTYNSIETSPVKQATRRIREQTIKENLEMNKKPGTKSAVYIEKAISDDDSPTYANLDKLDEMSFRGSISNTGLNARKPAQLQSKSNKDAAINKTRKLVTPNGSLSRNTADKVVSSLAHKINDEKYSDSLDKKNSSFKRKSESKKIEKSQQHSSHSARKTSIENTKKINGSIEKTHSINNDSIGNKHEHKSRSKQRQLMKDAPKEIMSKNGTIQSKKDSTERKSIAESASSSDKIRKKQSSKDKTNLRNETVAIIPKIDNSTIDKSTTSRHSAAKNTSKTRRSEYVINYDDKNGTVSSVRKVRPSSSSPRRKQTTKEVVKEKFKENLRNKSSDKAALLQPEDHQRNVNTADGKKKRKPIGHYHRSCQVL